MNRNSARRQAFKLLFGDCFGEKQATERLIEIYSEDNEYENDAYSLRIIRGVKDNKAQIDNLIEENLNKWKISRLPKTTLTILRIAIYELVFCDDVPDAVSINEAVEMSKTYGNEDDYVFINGLLGKIVRSK